MSTENKAKILKRFYRIESIDNGGYFYDTHEGLKNIPDMLSDCSICDGYKITATLMTQEDFDALPEFEGF